MKIKLNTVNDVKEFVGICEKYKACSIDVKQGRWVIDGKSILGIFSLNLTEILSVIIDSNNEDSKLSFYKNITKWKVNDAVEMPVSKGFCVAIRTS